jgi:hypothetical protein
MTLSEYSIICMKQANDYFSILFVSVKFSRIVLTSIKLGEKLHLFIFVQVL